MLPAKADRHAIRAASLWVRSFLWTVGDCGWVVIRGRQVFAGAPRSLIVLGLVGADAASASKVGKSNDGSTVCRFAPRYRQSLSAGAHRLRFLPVLIGDVHGHRLFLQESLLDEVRLTAPPRRRICS